MSGQVADLAHDWLLRDFFELGALPGSVPCARYHVRHLLREWHLSQLSDDVELVVSELMSNAVVASQPLDWPFPVRLWLYADQASVLVMVWDASFQAVQQLEPDNDAESGRGLQLVEAVCARWGWYRLNEAPGKVIWAFLGDEPPSMHHAAACQ